MSEGGIQLLPLHLGGASSLKCKRMRTGRRGRQSTQNFVNAFLKFNTYSINYLE